MRFLGIDTSGDHDISSPYVIGYAISDESSSIEKSNIGRAISEARAILNKPNYVFHAYHDDKKVREVLLDSLIKHGIRGGVIIILNRKFVNSFFSPLSKLIDKCSYAVYDNPIFDHILSKIVKKSTKVTSSKSLTPLYLPLQVADYFSHIWWEIFSHGLKDFNQFEKILSITDELVVIGLKNSFTLVKT
jgi:hypothetical protein